jgi:hypothetical protein
VFHLELRQFPHNFCRFNLGEEELRETVLDAWAHGEWVEVGERKWSPHQASLTVLEGPRLSMAQLSMGRGWRNALRQSQDVTSTLLAAAGNRDGVGGASSHGGTGQASAGAPDSRRSGERQPGDGDGAGIEKSPNLRMVADSLGLEVLARIGQEPAPITVGWRVARERYPESSASEALMLAEHAIRSLASAGLVEVLSRTSSGPPVVCESEEQLAHVLAAIDNWRSEDGSSSAVLRRR